MSPVAGGKAGQKSAAGAGAGARRVPSATARRRARDRGGRSSWSLLDGRVQRRPECMTTIGRRARIRGWFRRDSGRGRRGERVGLLGPQVFAGEESPLRCGAPLLGLRAGGDRALGRPGRHLVPVRSGGRRTLAARGQGMVGGGGLRGRAAPAGRERRRIRDDRRGGERDRGAPRRVSPREAEVRRPSRRG